MMKIVLAAVVAQVLLLAQTADGFRAGSRVERSSRARRASAVCQCAAASTAPPQLETECGFDHVPLAEALKQGDLLEADRLTRESLIKLAGEQAVQRGFVYFTEVKNLPYKDMATIDLLWRAYTQDKQGYSVQSKLLRSPRIAGDLTALYRRIGWSKEDGALLRWTADDTNEFIYDNEKAPIGHLPLTSTLRGTRLLRELMEHPAILDASETLP